MAGPKKGSRQKPAANQTIQDFEHALKEHNCLQDFRALVEVDCSAEWLMETVASIGLASIHHANLRNAPGKLNSRKLKTLLANTRSVARQWDQLFQTDFGKELLRFAGRDPFLNRQELKNTPSRLLSLARWASDICRGTANRRRPLYDDCLAVLMEYVRRTTGKYHDREVSALVSFATGEESYETTLPVWRSEHPDALSRARLRLAQEH